MMRYRISFIEYQARTAINLLTLTEALPGKGEAFNTWSAGGRVHTKRFKDNKKIYWWRIFDFLSIYFIYSLYSIESCFAIIKTFFCFLFEMLEQLFVVNFSSCFVGI